MDTHVEHPLHGPGRVVSLRRGGHLALVEFEALALPTLIPTRELRAIGGAEFASSTTTSATAPSSLTPPAPPTLRGTREASSALLALEAMRLGVVPARDLDAYTVGREAELTTVQSDLDSAAQTGGEVRVFLADYGVGKTHLLELIEQMARGQNFLTARVVLDATEMTPSHPRRVYHGLIRSLRYPELGYDESPGLGPLFERALACPEARDRFALDRCTAGSDVMTLLAEGMHLYLTPALLHYEALNDPGALRPERVDGWEEELWRDEARQLLLAWIEGYPTASNKEIVDHFRAIRGSLPHLYSLKDYRPWARIYSYVLSGIAALARASGYAGLVVLFDEAELYSLLSRENRDYARNVFKAISCAALGPESVPFDAESLNLGGYGILQDLPPRYGDAPGLYAVFAMTPNTEGRESLEEAAPRNRITELAHLSSGDYRHLSRLVCDFYASAQRDWAVERDAARQIESVIVSLTESGHVSNPRQAMKAIIELLDVHRYFPERSTGVIRNLQNLASF